MATRMYLEGATMVDMNSGRRETVLFGAGVHEPRDVTPCTHCRSTRAVHLTHPSRWSCRGCGRPREISS